MSQVACQGRLGLKATPLEAHGIEELLLKVFSERLFLRLLHDIADHANGRVGILDPALWFINQGSAIEASDHFLQ
jgi:hypothetical protein